MQNNWESSNGFERFSSSKLVQKSVEIRWSIPNYFANRSSIILNFNTKVFRFRMMELYLFLTRKKSLHMLALLYTHLLKNLTWINLKKKLVKIRAYMYMYMWMNKWSYLSASKMYHRYPHIDSRFEPWGHGHTHTHTHIYIYA